MVELDFRERERLGRQKLAERLKKLRARLALLDRTAARQPNREVPKDVEADKPSWWWQRD